MKRFFLKFSPFAIFLVLVFVPFALFLAGGWCIEPAYLCSTTTAIDQLGASLSNQSFSPFILTVLIFFTSLGDSANIVLFAIVALLVLATIRERLVAALFFIGLVLGDTLMLASKDFFNRPRPPEILYSFTRLGASYPSGHAFIAVAFYGFAGYVLWHHARSRVTRIVVAVLTLALIVAMGFSRVALDFHWLTDVFGGWLLGISILTLLIAAYRHVHRGVRTA
jgi:undecaprenyl-diphosphatase